MRQRLAGGLAACSLLFGCGSDERASEVPAECARFALSDRGDVRVFVVGHRQTVDDAVSYESYEQSFRRHLAAIAPCLSAARPNLIVFPENAALGAFLIGSRGETARSQELSANAFGAILGAYGQPFAWYSTRYPEASLRRRLVLSLTDVVWRAFDRTFGGIARDHGVWVMSSADIAPAERSDDPALIAALGDPDLPDQSEVWVASGPQAYNSAYLYDPSGALFGRVDKVFLTDPEEIDLELDNGSLAKLDVLQTPFARIGVATSRDAFYPPFMQRLEDLGAELVVQPEAFSGWALGELPTEWYPDVFTSSGWTHQQRYATIAHSLAPQYTGNFFDLYFDGQVHITERARPEQGLGAYVGQDPIPGFARLGPWVIDDPGTGSIDERRSQLRSVGLELLPGSGSERENGYIDSLVAADLELAAEPVAFSPDAARPTSRAVDPDGVGEQRDADVIGVGGGAFLVWRASDALRWATTSDGVSFELGGEVAAASDAQARPAACAAPDGRVAVVWQQGWPERVMAAVAPSAGAAFEPPLQVSSGPGPGWEPDCGFGASGELVVVWSDLASGVARLSFAERAGAAASFSAPQPVDATSAGAPRVQGTQLEPALANDASVVVWLDYRDRSWDVYAARRVGGSFGPSQRIDGAPPETHERLCGEPRVEASGNQLMAAWTDLRDRRAHPDIAFAVSTDGGATWSERRLVPGGPGSIASRSRGGSAMPRYRPAIAGDAIVFQDLAPAKGGLSLALVSAGTAQAPVRIDDTAAQPIHLTRPRAARLGSATLVVWQDNREGTSRIFAARLE